MPRVSYDDGARLAAWMAHTLHGTHDWHGRINSTLIKERTAYRGGRSVSRTRDRHRIVCPFTSRGNTDPTFWAGDATATPWAQLQMHNSKAFGLEACIIFVTNITGLATEECYRLISDWSTSWEGVLHMETAIPHIHSSANAHIHFCTHA